MAESIGSAGDATEPLSALKLPSFGTVDEESELPISMLRAANQCDDLRRKHEDNHGVAQTGSAGESLFEILRNLSVMGNRRLYSGVMNSSIISFSSSLKTTVSKQSPRSRHERTYRVKQV